jgi:hypothetical protein
VIALKQNIPPFFHGFWPMRVTKQMLGNPTRKRILYLDQNFLSTFSEEVRRMNGPQRRWQW